jgi:hypothetical protein
VKLLDLEPKWLMFEGRRVGFLFRCPLPGKSDSWQSCFVEKFYLFKARTGEYLKGADGEWLGSAPDSQCAIILECAPHLRELGNSCNWQSCDPECQWVVEGGIANASFETISVTPSLDGSKGGNWHGFVTNGEIVGGL